MYKTLTVDVFKKRTGLPADYQIEGLLAVGTWDLYSVVHAPVFQQLLEELGYPQTLKKIESVQLGHAYEFVVEGKKFWFVPVMGTAVMSQYAHMASLLGSKKNILVGTVGGLKEGILTAEFILPTASKGNDNAYMYDRTAENQMFYPNEKLRNSLKERLGELTVHEGHTTTCEVMFAETSEDVKQWSDEGYLGVEMEAAMMFALSKHFNIPSAAVLFVTDNLVEEITFFDPRHNESKAIRFEARKKQFLVALQELIAE